MFAVCAHWVETFQGKGSLTSNAVVEPQMLQQRLLGNHNPQRRFLLMSILGEASPWLSELYRKYGTKFNLSISVNIFWLSTLCQIIGIFSKWFLPGLQKVQKCSWKRNMCTVSFMEGLVFYCVVYNVAWLDKAWGKKLQRQFCSR